MSPALFTPNGGTCHHVVPVASHSSHGGRSIGTEPKTGSELIGLVFVFLLSSFLLLWLLIPPDECGEWKERAAGTRPEPSRRRRRLGVIFTRRGAIDSLPRGSSPPAVSLSHTDARPLRRRSHRKPGTSRTNNNDNNKKNSVKPRGSALLLLLLSRFPFRDHVAAGQNSVILGRIEDQLGRAAESFFFLQV